MSNPNLTRDHGSHSTVNVQRVTEPSQALEQLLVQNNQLQIANAAYEEKSRQWAAEKEQMQNEVRDLAQFRQILTYPIEKITVEFTDGELLRQIRGFMVQMFGRGGQMDAEGKWAQTVVNTRLQLVIRQLVYNGLQRWPQVKAQLQEIIKLQGLM